MNGAPEDYNSEVPPTTPETADSFPSDPGIPSKGVRIYAMIMHLSLLSEFLMVSFAFAFNFYAPFTSIAFPIIFWLIGRGSSPYINRHGNEIVNFLINYIIFFLVFIFLPFYLGSTIEFAIVFSDIMALIIAILFLVSIYMNAIKAVSGQPSRYPCLFRFIK